MYRKVHSCREINTWRTSAKFMIIFLPFFGLLVKHTDIFLKGIVVNCQDLIQPIAEKSSPSQVTSSKGGFALLHWSYHYLGDGTRGGITSTYKEQIIGFKSSSDTNIKVLAKRIGESGVLTLQSPTPPPFNGRVQVIPSKNQLTIRVLQYNDSFYQFSSTVTASLLIGGTTSPFTTHLKPVVSLIINGKPVFRKDLLATQNVNENGNLALKIEMDGNPKPSVKFRWTHLPESSAMVVPAVKLYPFVYTSTGLFNNLDGNFCARKMQITISNSYGSSVKTVGVSVIFKKKRQYNLRAGKIFEKKCVEVKWNKVVSGACNIQYTVKLKDSKGNILHNYVENNIGEIKKCNLEATYDRIKKAELNIMYYTLYENLVTSVSENPVPSSSSLGIVSECKIYLHLVLSVAAVTLLHRFHSC